MRALPALGAALALALAAAGGLAYTVSYIDNGKYWGVPVRAVATEQVEAPADLPASVAWRVRQVAALVEQQKYLYRKLLLAQTDLERDSTLDPSLLERIGPMANMHLRDLTGTGEALHAVAAYEANLPFDSPDRRTTSDLRLALAQEQASRSEFFHALSEWRRAEQDAAMARERRESELRYQRMMEPQLESWPEGPEWDPYATEPSPVGTTSISGRNSELLGRAHWVMADIHMTQAKMADLVTGIVRDLERISAVAPPPTTLMFVRDRSAGHLEVGQPLYRCSVGVWRCARVGSVAGTSGERSESPSPTSGKSQPGFLVPIELTDPSAANARILYIHEPPAR